MPSHPAPYAGPGQHGSQYSGRNASMGGSVHGSEMSHPGTGRPMSAGQMSGQNSIAGPTPPISSAGQSAGRSISGNTSVSRISSGSQIQYREKIIEVPEIQIVEKIVPVTNIIQQEKIRRVPKVEVVERVVPVTKPIIVERIVEVPQIKNVEVPFERIVEVPDVQTHVVTKEVEVPTKVDVPLVQPRQVPVEQEIERNVPVPVDVTTVQPFRMPQIKPKYREVPVPIYVPRYIEVPVPAQFCPSEGSDSRLPTHLSLGPPISPQQNSMGPYMAGAGSTMGDRGTATGTWTSRRMPSAMRTASAGFNTAGISLSRGVTGSNFNPTAAGLTQPTMQNQYSGMVSQGASQPPSKSHSRLQSAHPQIPVAQ